MPENDHKLKHWTAGKFIVEEFPRGYQLLNQELAVYADRHPKLMVLLQGQPVDELDIKISIIAHYCGVALDGTYTLESRSELCAILAGRLEMLREVVSVKPQEIQ